MNIERETLKVWLEMLEIAHGHLENAQYLAKGEMRIPTGDVFLARSHLGMLMAAINTILDDAEPRGPMGLP